MEQINNQKWIKAEDRPKKSGSYLIHVWESPYFSFGGFKKESCEDRISITKGKEYITEAMYNKKSDTWEFNNDNEENYEIHGLYELNDYKDSVYGLKIVEWQNIPAPIPVKTEYQPITDEIEPSTYRNRISSNEARVISYDYSELIKRRYESSKKLEKCKYKQINSSYSDIYIEINEPEEYTALIEYYTDTEVDSISGKIRYIRPDYIEYSGPGLYKVTHNNNICNIIKLDSISEMFNGIK